MNIPAKCFNPARLLSQSELNNKYQYVAKILGFGKDMNEQYVMWIELYTRKTGEPEQRFFTVKEFGDNFAPLYSNKVK